MKVLTRVPALLLGLSVATVALPCGDKLAAIGGGVRFERVYAARHPGRIALFVPQDSRLRQANESLHLADALKRAGHQVIVIEDARDLPNQLQPDRVDLLLADVDDARALAASVASVPRALMLQASAARDVSAAKLTATSKLPAQCVAQLSKRTSVQLLRKVDEALDRNRNGLPPACTGELFTRGASAT